MIITFFDKTKIEIDDDRANRIVSAMNAGTELIEIDGNYYKTSAIASLTKRKALTDTKMIGGAVYDKNADRTPTTELSEEQLQKNLGRIQQLRQQFFQRKK